MADESYSFTAARTRLEEIVTQVRKKDTSLEKSLDLLEEGVRLANQCTELIDHADWAVGGIPGAEAVASGAPVETGEGIDAGSTPSVAEPVPDAASDEGAAGTLASADGAEESAAYADDVASDSVADADDDGFDAADEAWADDTEPSDEPGIETDPAADEG